MKKKRVLALVLTMMMIGISGCGNSDAKAEAEAIVTAFEASDTNAVNQIIFDEYDLCVDDELSEIFDAEEEKSGIISKIIELDTITVKKVSDSEIVYEIEAPDLTKVFEEISADENADMTEEELEQYIINYMKNTDMVKNTVSVPYVLEDGQYCVNYKTEEFINAVTGGLLDAYQSLYEEMLEDYLAEMEVSE